MIVDVIFQNKYTKVLFKGSDLTKTTDVKNIILAIAVDKYRLSSEIIQSTEFNEFIYGVVPWKSYWILIGIDQNNDPFITWGNELLRG